MLKVPRVCYVWPAHDILVLLAYVGTLCREVAVVALLLSIDVSKLY
jgi:hypothetical protein